CDFGYIGPRNKQSRTLECNKALFTLFTLEEPKQETHSDGIVYLKGKINKRIYHSIEHLKVGANGLYWEIQNDLTLSATGCEPSKFALELCQTHSRIVIKAPNGMYVRAEQN